jgi:UDPglucose--hexose-1-phosphate uridylyltransferase
VVIERRRDPLTGEWITFSTHRQDRTFLPSTDACPLCPEREDVLTEIPRAHYDIVVFDNRFPSFTASAPPATVPGVEGFLAAPATGAAEVIVYSEIHDLTMAGMDTERIRRIIGVWADRYGVLAGREDIDYVLIFENKGIEMGVTIPHPHGQIYGFPDIPPRPKAELERALEHLASRGTCLLCDIVAKERGDGIRVVADNRSFVAFVPFAPRFPYEVHVVARRHATSLLELTEEERRALAQLLKTVLVAYDSLFDFSMPYVMVLHQTPVDGGDWLAVSHFHIEFYPPYRTAGKLKYLAGSELGGGAFMNDAVPEASAARLREPGDRLGPFPS